MKSVFALALIAAVQAQMATTTTTTTPTSSTSTAAKAAVTAATTAVTTAATTAIDATKTAAAAAAAMATSLASDFADKMDFYKNAKSNWVGFNTDLAGNTPGWQLTGTFGTRQDSKGDPFEFYLETNVLAPSTFVSAAGQVWQSYVTFNGWDPASTATSQVNNTVLMGYVSGGSATAGWTTSENFTGNFCAAGSLNGKTKGGHTTVSLTSNASCVSGWDDYPDCSLALQTSGRLQSSCEMTRWFEYPGTLTIAIGQPVTFTAGFVNWNSNTVKSTETAAAFGYTATPLTYTIIEGAVSLATMSVAAAALIALSF